MSHSEPGPLDVALLYHGYRESASERAVCDLATALRDAGHRVSVLGSHPSTRALDAPLHWRGFATPLAHLPLTLRALMHGDYDIAHAFSPQDAYAALIWRRRVGRPAVFTCAETIARERLADRRLRLRLLTAAIEESDAVVVADEQARAAALRWLLVEPEVIDPHDGAAHEELYRRVVSARGR